MLATRWVVNLRFFEEAVEGGIKTIHVITESEKEAHDLAARLTKELGPPPEPEDMTITEVPATWVCRGEDGCMVS